MRYQLVEQSEVHRLWTLYAESFKQNEASILSDKIVALEFLLPKKR